MDSTENNNPPNQGRIRVLIADDDAPTRILLKAAISQWGFETIEARDGDEAWEIINQEDAPRILILDWLMPKIDGIALCERCRKELTLQPFIILLTQMSGSTNTVKGLEAGADEFLAKPFNMAELRSRLSIGARIMIADQQNAIYKKLLASLAKNIMAIDKKSQEAREITEKSSDKIKLSEKLSELQGILENVKTSIHE